ncbi:hypothetical protein A2U01_0118674, partial [Trifolium medium]|nr:hypothetical protein [Trifolium medium]
WLFSMMIVLDGGVVGFLCLWLRFLVDGLRFCDGDVVGFL